SLLKQEVYGIEPPMSSKLNPTPIFESAKCSVDNSIPDLSSQNNHDNGEGSSRKRKCKFIQTDKFTEKKARRVTKDNEKSILDVFAMKFLTSTPMNSDINEVLSHIDSSWDLEKVLQYIRNARKRFKGKNINNN
ncbi:4091_t:CDS:2, partial [Gigaspora rosea]